MDIVVNDATKILVALIRLSMGDWHALTRIQDFALQGTSERTNHGQTGVPNTPRTAAAGDGSIQLHGGFNDRRALSNLGCR